VSNLVLRLRADFCLIIGTMDKPNETTASQQKLPPRQEVSREEELEDERFTSSSPDRQLLQGPNWRMTDFKLVMSVVRDFMRAFRALHFVGPCITVFGSARTPESHEHYQLAKQMGGELVKLGFTVMTGGGPGIMEAANRGAKEAGGRSVGCNIKLPMEQFANRWLDHGVTLEHFFVRKTILMKYSYGFVVMPGGVGTMDETFEALTLIQTGKIRNFPIVLMGSDYWQPLMDFVKSMPMAGMISPEDLKLVHLTDSVEDAIQHLKDRAIQQFGLRRRRSPDKRLPWLLEPTCGDAEVTKAG